MAKSQLTAKERVSLPTTDEEVGKRLGLVVNRIGTRLEAGVAAGVSDDMIIHYIKGRSKLPFKVASALCAVAGVRMDWLATGDGPMTFDAWEAEIQVRALDQVRIPRYDVQAAPEGDAPAEWLVFSKAWLSESVGVAISRLSAMAARGDSMAPEISDGDLLLVDNSERAVTADGIYVFRMNDELAVKRLQRLADGEIAVKSSNERYDDYAIDAAKADTLQIVGRVRWHGRRI